MLVAASGWVRGMGSDANGCGVSLGEYENVLTLAAGMVTNSEYTKNHGIVPFKLVRCMACE